MFVLLVRGGLSTIEGRNCTAIPDSVAGVT